MSGQGPPTVYPVEPGHAELLAAWLTVIQGTDGSESRLLVILALPAFGARSCIRCVLCEQASARGDIPAQSQPRMRITQIVAHRNQSGEHRFELDREVLRDITDVPLPDLPLPEGTQP